MAYKDLSTMKKTNGNGKNGHNGKEPSSQFNSATFGELSFIQTMAHIFSYIKEDSDYSYRLIIGTDSQPNHETADFVSAIIVHRVGAGGIYFWQRRVMETFSLRDRIYKEALLSLDVAEKVTEELTKFEALESPSLEIHVDVGKNGETRDLIAEVVGMIRGNGFTVKIKPEAYGAAIVADRHA